jgi:hypothetical protein
MSPQWDGSFSLGGELSLSYNPFPSQNPGSSGMSPLGLTTLNKKNHPIVVTLGGIGSSYASLPLQYLAFYPCYKLCNNRALTHSRGKLEGSLKTILLGMVWDLRHMNETPFRPLLSCGKRIPHESVHNHLQLTSLFYLLFSNIQCLHITSLGPWPYIISTIYITKPEIKNRDVTRNNYISSRI